MDQPNNPQDPGNEGPRKKHTYRWFRKLYGIDEFGNPWYGAEATYHEPPPVRPNKSKKFDQI